MYDQLADLQKKRRPFSTYTTDVLWASPYLSERMLHYHLDESGELASRRPQAIDRIVGWIDEKFGLGGKRICDLGCGPGLYTRRYAERRALVSGLDFSAHSIAYAQEMAQQSGYAIDYRVANYLKDDFPPDQDLITLIYYDLCALSAEQRAVIYRKVRKALKPDGAFLFDVLSLDAFGKLQESTVFGRRLSGDFWAAGDYFEFQHIFKYPDEKISLDQYTIIEPDRRWQVFNWLQYFDRAGIAAELAQNGFEVSEIVDDLARLPEHASDSHFFIAAKPLEK